MSKRWMTPAASATKSRPAQCWGRTRWTKASPASAAIYTSATATRSASTGRFRAARSRNRRLVIGDRALHHDVRAHRAQLQDRHRQHRDREHAQLAGMWMSRKTRRSFRAAWWCTVFEDRAPMMTGGNTRVNSDVPPFFRLHGIQRGVKDAGTSSGAETGGIWGFGRGSAVKRAYQLLYRSGRSEKEGAGADRWIEILTPVTLHLVRFNGKELAAGHSL